MSACCRTMVEERHQSAPAPARWARNGITSSASRFASLRLRISPEVFGPISVGDNSSSACVERGSAIAGVPPRSRARGIGVRRTEDRRCAARRRSERAAWVIRRRARPRIHRRLEGVGQLGRRLEPLAASLAEAVDARVLDHEPGGASQGLDEELVLLGERFAAGLLGQVEVPEDGSPDPDRYAEERRHRWVVGREAGRLRMEPTGPAIRITSGSSMSSPRMPESARQVTDQAVLLRSDPGRDELDQSVRSAPITAECGVPSSRQLGRRLDDPQEYPHGGRGRKRWR